MIVEGSAGRDGVGVPVHFTQGGKPYAKNASSQESRPLTGQMQILAQANLDNNKSTHMLLSQAHAKPSAEIHIGLRLNQKQQRQDDHLHLAANGEGRRGAAFGGALAAQENALNIQDAIGQAGIAAATQPTFVNASLVEPESAGAKALSSDHYKSL